MTVRIRPYEPRDWDALGDICVRTSDVGRDGTHLYPDPGLVSSVYAWPYAALEPKLVFVADNGERAVGYVLGTSDTALFAKRFRNEWLPEVASRFPRPSGPLTTQADAVADLLHAPERMVPLDLDDYPAHLHIDLLPGHQRGGHGRALMTRFLDALRDRGVTGVHLGVSVANTPALAFYERLGFHELTSAGVGGLSVFLGKRIAPNARLAAEAAG
ncbi:MULTISPECIES: GNAT family N-acetyltransferase [Actinosynnema]|uniref:GNAT family N-acetyltransferase n=1 Tax=Actinosynnema TaxID=40566 RepID=UPI0020A2ADD8|nr:GNAT family N-acetyltransferase [Actinosynnema pretiosum]MCP2094303.1 Acetyltransferase (GNAT) family protein [Actinosynnema pretiosum]